MHTLCIHNLVFACKRTPANSQYLHAYLLPPLLFAFVLRGLQHLLLPQVEEVGGVSVELQCILLVVPADMNGAAEGKQHDSQTQARKR